MALKKTKYGITFCKLFSRYRRFAKRALRHKTVCIHCGYDKLGAGFGDSTEASFGQIPFRWQENQNDPNFFPTDEVTESLNLPKISSKKIGLRYSSALLGFLLVNQEYRNLIHSSTNEILKMLDDSFPEDKQKSFSSNLFLEHAAHDNPTLSALLEFINIETNNILKYVDEDENDVSLGILKVRTHYIPKIITDRTFITTPTIIATDVDGNHFKPNESFPKMIVNFSNREQYYALSGIRPLSGGKILPHGGRFLP